MIAVAAEVDKRDQGNGRAIIDSTSFCSAYYVPGPVPGTWDTVVKTVSSSPLFKHGDLVERWEKDKQANTIRCGSAPGLT